MKKIEEREDEHAPVWLDATDNNDVADKQSRVAGTQVHEDSDRGVVAGEHSARELEQGGHGDGLDQSHAAGHGHSGSHDQSHGHDHSRDHDDHSHDHGHDHGHDDSRDRGDGHSHGHDHSHTHAGHHHHHHAPVPGHGFAFALAVALNVAIVVIQALYGVLAHSTALLADAGHNLSDVLGLLLAWGAAWLTTRRPSARYTFGYGSSSILASLANAALLLFACGVIVAEAIGRLMNPAPVAGLAVFVVATVGVVVNGISAWLFMRGQKEDLNIRGAFLHMAADAGVSAAVAISGLVILYTNWTWLDPLMSLLVVAVVVYGTWGLLRDSVRLALNAVPSGVDLQSIRDYLADLPGVEGVHDLHVWALSTTGNALTVHLVMPAGHPGDERLDGIVLALRERFSMQHATLQVDLGTTSHRCAMDHPAEQH
ncbi:cation diffusion facilitator family transporter [Paraburkholderia caledonica]|jgi:cobalt-zinc-cadmium efflux system protein|uniref:cation diffusion facilitator family transporter n=1 Tax=Paraburkholderia caledonica TaxID=134536 RepID=UPI000481BC1A|nr:cation diffusion facilitator family transporter [Paraburkholderia caledonica]